MHNNNNEDIVQKNKKFLDFLILCLKSLENKKKS